MDNQPTGTFLFSTLIDEAMRHKLEQMLKEGATEEQIRAVCPSYRGFVTANVGHVAKENQHFALLKAYMDKYPIFGAVEGSIVEPITDEGRLLT